MRRSSRRPSPMGQYRRGEAMRQAEQREADANVEWANRAEELVGGFTATEIELQAIKLGVTPEQLADELEAGWPAPKLITIVPPTPHQFIATLRESLARDVKCRKMGDLVMENDIATMDVRRFTDEQWGMLATAAGYHHRSSDGLLPSRKTRERLVEMLEQTDRIARRAVR